MAVGSVEAIRRQRTEAAELTEQRRENRRLKEEVQVMRNASAFFSLSGRRNNEREASVYCRPRLSARHPADVPGHRDWLELVSRLARRASMPSCGTVASGLRRRRWPSS